jgi:hypothetical protein
VGLFSASHQLVYDFYDTYPMLYDEADCLRIIAQDISFLQKVPTATKLLFNPISASSEPAHLLEAFNAF